MSVTQRIQSRIRKWLDEVHDGGRIWWMMTPVALFAVVAVLAPAKIGFVVYKLALIFLSGFFGFRMDRRIFHYARPDQVPAGQRPAAWIRRAIMIVGAMIAVAVAV